MYIHIYMQYNVYNIVYIYITYVYMFYIHWETHLFSLHRSGDVGVRSMWEDLP